MENNTKKSGKAGYIITIIFLLIVIIILSVLFAFKEKIFKTGSANNTCIADPNALIQENTTLNETTNTIAQERHINSVKGYWISKTNDLFLSIKDSTDSLGEVTTNFSLIGATGITSTTCTIDSTKITCDDKVYTYSIQGNNLLLSYDNNVYNFVPSNYYQISKQSKNYYANMMGYTIKTTKLPDDLQITGDYTNNALVGTWVLTNGNGKYIFSIVDGNLTATSINTATNETTLNIPVGMDKKYIEFVDNSSLYEEIYSYTLIDNDTLQLNGVTNKTFAEYKREQ